MSEFEQRNYLLYGLYNYCIAIIAYNQQQFDLES